MKKQRSVAEVERDLAKAQREKDAYLAAHKDRVNKLEAEHQAALEAEGDEA